MANEREEKIIVAVSGGFDPLHIGHVRLFAKARKLGDELVVILNNDNWLRQKKGYVFMPQDERAEILRALSVVDRVVLSNHGPEPEDMSVREELKLVQPNIFANGGDRKEDNVPEMLVCDEMGCKTMFNVGAGGKVQSSSWLGENFIGGVPCPCGSGKMYKDCHAAAAA